MALRDSRRLLDGGAEDGVLSTLSDIGDFLEFQFTGVLPSDIAAGAVDETALSRPQRASLAIDGRVPNHFEPPNPWSVGFDFDPGLTAAALGAGGIVVVMSANASTFDTLQNALFPPRFAFLWDDSRIAQQGVLDLNVTSRTLLIASIGPPQGTRLTLWCTDPAVSWGIVRTGRPEEAAAIRGEVFGALGAAPGAGVVDGITAVFQQFADVQKEAVLAAIIVGGIVLYFLAKGELAAAHGGVG